jgi:hypothetical protein
MDQTASVTAAAGQYLTKDELIQAQRDEIERLHMIAECPTCAESGYDNADYHRLHRAWCDSVAEIEQLRAERDEWQLSLRNIEAARQGGLDEIERLRAALEPFADVSGEGDEDFPDETKATIKFGRTTYYSITLGDFRRAAVASQASSS